jgi:hypothetical protein
VLEGSIAPLGTQYVLGLRATHCRTGDRLDEQQRASRTERGRPERDRISSLRLSRVIRFASPVSYVKISVFACDEGTR